jgi:MFS family permease
MDKDKDVPLSFFDKNPVLRNKEFLCLFFFRFGIFLVLTLQSTAIYFWIYQITHSNFIMGMTGAVEVVPSILFSVVSGYVIDVNKKRKMLLLCAIGYALLGLGLAVLSTQTSLNHLGLTWTLYGIFFFIFVGGMLRAFLNPSMFAMLGLVIPREHYTSGASWSSMAFKVGAVVGPLLFGVIDAVMSLIVKAHKPVMAGHAQAIESVTGSMFLIVFVELILIILVLLIKPKPFVKPPKKESVMESLTQGLDFIFRTKALLGAQMLDMFTVLFGGAVALLPAFIDIHRMNEIEYGILRAAPGVGSIVMMVLMVYLPLNTQPGKKLLWSCAGFGVATIVFGLSREIVLAAVALMFTGMFDAVSVVVRNTILQLVTPDEMRGRVSSVNTMFTASSNELGDFESGIMATYIGTVRAIIAGGCLTLGVVGVIAASTKKLREFDYGDYK